MMETQPSTAGSEPGKFIISRVFDAPRDSVWKGWTESERMRQWWGPKGFLPSYCENDLRVRGMFHYCLRGPDGTEIWGRFVYREIDAPHRMVYVGSFSDKDKGVTRHPMAPVWPLEMLTTVEFAEENGKTRVKVTWEPLNATEDELKAFENGHDSMRQGWTGTMEQYDAYLAKS